MNRRKIYALLPLLLVGSTAMALWIAGMDITGYLTGSSGQEAVVLDVYFTVDETTNPDIETVTYSNSDGEVELLFGVTENYESSDGDCIMSPLTDYRWYMKKTSEAEGEYKELGVDRIIKTFPAGDTDLDVKVVGHDYRCPTDGTGYASITGTVFDWCVSGTPVSSVACETSGHLGDTTTGGSADMDFYACDIDQDYLGKEQVWSFTGTGQDVTVEWVSGFEPTEDLDIIILGVDCNAEECDTIGDNSVTFTSVNGQEYYIVVDGKGSVEDAFQFQVGCV